MMRRPLVLLSAVVGLAACSDGAPVGAGSTPSTAPPNGASVSAPSRPPGPGGACAFPGRAELRTLKRDADVVLRGTVDHAPRKRPGSGPVVPRSYYRVSVDDVLFGKPPDGATVTIGISGDQDPRLDFPETDYILFLYTEFSARNPNPDVGEVTYELTAGLRGVFPVREEKVFNQCLDLSAQDHRVESVGDGRGASVSEFASEVVGA